MAGHLSVAMLQKLQVKDMIAMTNEVETVPIGKLLSDAGQFGGVA